MIYLLIYSCCSLCYLNAQSLNPEYEEAASLRLKRETENVLEENTSEYQDDEIENAKVSRDNEGNMQSFYTTCDFISVISY